MAQPEPDDLAEPEPDVRVYLSDGLYAEWDGWYVRLSADRNGTRHAVYIERQVWAELTRYVRREDIGWLAARD